MDFGAVLNSFFQDDKFAAVVALVVLDIVLGVGASFYNKGQSFALTYLANFLRNDVLGKVFPWLVLYIGAKATRDSSILLGIDMGNIADVVWAGVSIALIGSLVSSLTDFGVKIPAELGRGGSPTPPPAK